MEPQYEYTKIDDSTIGVTKTITKTKVLSYDIDALNAQLVAIQAQQDTDNAKREAEKTEVKTFIAQATALGIVSASSDN